MTSLPPQPRPGIEQGLPKVLWVGTAVFAVVSAGALYLGLNLGRQSFESAPEKRVEGAPFHSPRTEARTEPEPPQGGVSADDKKTAGRHYNLGVAAFMRGDYKKARDEWILCTRFDSAIADCAAGLQRIDNVYGGGK